MAFRFYMPMEVLFGEGRVKELGVHMDRFGMDRALLVTDGFFKQSGLAQTVQEISDGRIVDVFSDVAPNPTQENVESCVAFAQKVGAKCIVALGGGSVIDCAKVSGTALHDGMTMSALLSGHAPTGMVPLLTIPTTAGTSSDLTFGGIISCGEEHAKRTFGALFMHATATIIDPELTYSCPASVTAAAGADVIAHAIDSMSSRGANMLTIDLGISAVKKAFQALPLAVKSGTNVAARRAMSEACLMAGMTFSQTATAASHACSYEITTSYNVPHGEACALTLDAWIRFNGSQVSALQECAQALGYADTDQFADALDTMFGEIGLRRSLGEMNIPAEDIPRLAACAAAATNMANNALPVTESQIQDVLTGKL